MTKVPIAVSSDEENASMSTATTAAGAPTEASPGEQPPQDATRAASEPTDDGATASLPPQPEAEGEDAGADDDSAQPEGKPAQSAESDTQPDAVQAAQAALEAMQQERDKARDALLRNTADFDNFRKRTRRELEESKMRGKDDAVRELLPVFDNLERAVQASENATDVASVLEGVRMVLKLFDDTAQRMGLNRVPGVGSRFDPSVHEAIQQIESDEHEPGTIVNEVAAGYMFGKRLIRAGMVVVAKAPPPKPVAANAEPSAESDDTSDAAESDDTSDANETESPEEKS